MLKIGAKVLLAAAVLGSVATGVRAEADIAGMAEKVTKSLVVVDFTLRNENTSREDSGMGILVGKEGTILVSGSLINEAFPKEWITDIKVRMPGNNFEPMPAKILGRTRDRLFTYLKLEKPVEAPVFAPGKAADAKLGQSVFSVAILGKSGGYEPYVGKTDVRGTLKLTHTLFATASFGLTRGNSPVFDVNSGDFVGLTMPPMGESFIMRDSGGARRIEMMDEDQSASFLPAGEIEGVFKDVPTDVFDLRRPWLGIDDVTGLQEDVRALKKIEQPAGLMVGSVIAGEAADKAGVKPRDIILTIDGKEFSKSPVPELMLAQFSRVIDRMKPADKLTLGVLREGKKIELPVTLGTSPKLASEMAHTYSPKVGVVTRDLVFTDWYSRKLPSDTKGAMVALVKNGAPAALGSTPLQPGYLITKLNDQTIEDQKQFLEVLKGEEEKADLKEMVFVVIQRSGETTVCRIDLTK